MAMQSGIFPGLLCVLALGHGAQSSAQAASVVPKPVKLEIGERTFNINGDTRILADTADAGAARTAGYLASVLRPATGFPLSVQALADGETGNAIVLCLLQNADNLGKEGYRLDVTPSSITIAAPSDTGLFYGVQTLRQLMPAEILSATPAQGAEWTVPCVHIEDYPRFAWRGILVDVSRHFMPKEALKEFIDAMALQKMNSLQLHLTDDQGWRIEIRKYPKLTEVGAWREKTVVGHAGRKPWKFDGQRHGGFYTQDDIRELVAYAAQRHVRIVPEIEMPGHAQAAIASYPELGNTKEQLPVWPGFGINKNIFSPEENTILFLQHVLAEVVDLFPSLYIHVGGDEAVKDQWKKSRVAQERIETLGLEDEDELQSYFIRRMDAFLTERGRRLVGWDEILEGGLAEGATVMSWRGEEGGIKAANAGHDVVMAPNAYTYFDYYQGDKKTEPLAIGGNLPLEKVYSFNPIPGGLEPDKEKHILGAQAQLWTEYIATPEHLEYMAFPRACALAEVVWSPQESRDYGDFRARLAPHLERLDALGVHYRSPE